MLTPTVTESRTPPTRDANELPPAFACKSHTAISTAAFAMGCPRIPLKMGSRSAGVSITEPGTLGRIRPVRIDQAVSVVSYE